MTPRETTKAYIKYKFGSFRSFCNLAGLNYGTESNRRTYERLLVQAIETEPKEFKIRNGFRKELCNQLHDLGLTLKELCNEIGIDYDKAYGSIRDGSSYPKPLSQMLIEAAIKKGVQIEISKPIMTYEQYTETKKSNRENQEAGTVAKVVSGPLSGE